MKSMVCVKVSSEEKISKIDAKPNLSLQGETSMNEDEKKKLIYQIAQMYYYDGLTQAEIAERLKVSKPSISRLLAEARQRKIVEIILHYPYQRRIDLEKSLITRFQLHDAYVLMAEGLAMDEAQSGVGVLAAEMLDKYLAEQMVLAISRGRNVYSTVKAIRPRPELNLKVVQVQGALGDRLDDGSDLGFFLSRLSLSEIRLLNAPLILEKPELAQSLLNEPSIRSTLELAKNADIALLGIGSTNPDVFSLYRHKMVSLEEVEGLRKSGVVGDVAGCFIDQNGNEVDIEFNRRLVRINLEDLKKIPLRIGVACGLARIDAVRAVVKSKLINILVIDSITTSHLLEN